MTETVHDLPHTRFAIHPRNMRRVYPDDQVRQMADSILQRGVIQPLIAVQSEKSVTMQLIIALASTLYPLLVDALVHLPAAIIALAPALYPLLYDLYI